MGRVHAEDRPVMVNRLERAIRERVPYEAEFRIVRLDGTIRWVRDRGGVFCGEDGEPAYMTGAVMDVTELRLIEQSREDYLRIISHELRQPLTVIMAQAQLMEKVAEDPKRVRTSTRAIATTAWRITP